MAGATSPSQGTGYRRVSFSIRSPVQRTEEPHLRTKLQLALSALAIAACESESDTGFAVRTAFDPPDRPPSCQLGTVAGDVFGRPSFFANGMSLAPGRYRVTYAGGCMKYNNSQGWSVSAYALGDPRGSAHWWLVSGDVVRSVIPPGTIGFDLGQGGFATFDECVQANLALPPRSS